jgi:uncharacterized protein
MTLKDFFTEHTSVALAFSGGTDSSYLLYAALSHGATVKPYFIKSAFQPEFEFKDALELAEKLHTTVTVIEHDVLTHDLIASNPKDRCYHCKTALFSLLKAQALADGFSVLMDGTNASDSYEDRPGMRALEELSVLSPLRDCGITKDQVRALSQEAGLFTWNKPAYACLATRVPTDTRLTHSLLKRVELSEDALFKLGFSDFRVRVEGNGARLELPSVQMYKALDLRVSIMEALGPYFAKVTLDLTGR